MYEKYHDVFRATGLVDGIDIDDFDKTIQELEPAIETYAEDETIASLQDGTLFGIILSGGVRGIETRSDGTEELFYIYRAGDTFGALLVFSRRVPLRFRQIKAMADTKMMWLPTSFIDTTEPLEHISRVQLQYNLLRIVSEKGYRLFRELSYARARTIKERIARYLFDCYFDPDQGKEQEGLVFTIEYDREDMANYLAVPRQSLTRTLSELRDEGIISFRKSTFIIEDPARLEKLL